MPLEAVGIISALLVALAAAVLDLWYGKVFNWLTVPAAAWGLILGGLQGPHGLVNSIAGLGLGLSLWFVGACGGRLMGGGDVKLMAAVGALTGPKFFLIALIAGIFFGGLVAIIYALNNRVLVDSVQRLGVWAWTKLNLRHDVGLLDDDPRKRVPYAVGLALGVALAALLLA